MKLPRLTFLARFTLVTFAVAVAAAIALAVVLETLHQRAVQTDLMLGALGKIDARLDAPLRRVAVAGPQDPLALEGLRDAKREADLQTLVAGLRIYRSDGEPLFPAGAPRSPMVGKALATDGIVWESNGRLRTIYETYAATAQRRFVVAVDFDPEQARGAFDVERLQVGAATSAVVALIFCALVALAAGASRELERRRLEAERTFMLTLTTLADAIDWRDPYTAGHARRVAAYARTLAVALRQSPATVAHIENAALLHDLGKISVPDAVLFKAGPLDPEERRLICTHPVLGARLLESAPETAEIVPCVLHHHERYDGLGYPDGLAGEAIPLGARIIAVADAFDAMTTDRPYRRGLSVDAAVAELLRGKDAQFDRRCATVFAELVLRGDVAPPPRPAEPARFGQRALLETESLT